MAIWTVLEVCCQSKNNNYWHGLNVFMAQYYGDNVHGILDCVKGGKVGSKSDCWFDSPTPLDVIYD